MNWRVATFNANSIRSRLDLILGRLEKHRPNVLCVQETKVRDSEFPREAFAGTGFEVVFHGQKSYNGVALITRSRPEDVIVSFGDEGAEGEARMIMATVDGVKILNTYVPQGRDPDSEHFEAKIAFFHRIKEFLSENHDPAAPLIWAGDLNVAPEPEDVYDPKRMEGHVCFHPREREALAEIKEWGLIDVFRLHNKEAKQYTFWDYRLPKALERNLGWRLDHILATRPLADASRGAWIDFEARALPKPSDHTFLVADFEL